VRAAGMGEECPLMRVCIYPQLSHHSANIVWKHLEHAP